MIQIIATPGSGDGRARSIARRLQKALTRRKYETHIETFADLGRLIEWAQTCRPTFSHLICVGGDATLSAAAVASVRLSVPLLPVPSGFGNIFARAFNHPQRTDRLIDLLERGQIRRVDVGTVNGGEIFLSHQSYGLLAEIQATVERSRAQPRSKMLRHLAYYAMAPRFLLGIQIPTIKVEVDGTLLTDNAALVTVANVETYRGYLSLTPGASPQDGLFDIFVMPRTTMLGVWTRLFKLAFNVRGRWTGMVLRRGRHVRVTMDGQKTDEVTVSPRALPLIVPAVSAPARVERRPRRWLAAARRRGPAAQRRSTPSVGRVAQG
jgi:diacylglycerol kinase family enzyme